MIAWAWWLVKWAAVIGFIWGIFLVILMAIHAALVDSEDLD